MRRLLHEEYPEIFGLVYPRAISGPNSHPSARLVAEELAIPAMLAMPGHEEGFDTVTQYGYATVVGLVAAGMPTYFASRPLLEALLETDPPEDTALAEMPWPHDAALFVLPWDFLVSPDGDCPYLAVARQPGGARVSLPLPGAWTCDMGRAGFSLMTSPVRAEAGSMYGSRLSFEDTPTFAGAMDPRLASMYFPHGMDGGPDGPAPLAEGDGAFNRRLPDLARCGDKVLLLDHIGDVGTGQSQLGELIRPNPEAHGIVALADNHCGPDTRGPRNCIHQVDRGII